MISPGISHVLLSDGSTGAGGYKMASYVWVVGAGYRIGLSIHVVSYPQVGSSGFFTLWSQVHEGESESCETLPKA